MRPADDESLWLFPLRTTRPAPPRRASAVLARLQWVKSLLADDRTRRAGPYLAWRSATGEIRAAPVDFDVFLGRDPSCTVLIDDPVVSRRHARVHRDAEGVWLEDLGLRNGIRVNGAPARKRQLCDGDVIEAGGFRVAFLWDQENEAAKS